MNKHKEHHAIKVHFMISTKGVKAMIIVLSTQSLKPNILGQNSGGFRGKIGGFILF